MLFLLLSACDPAAPTPDATPAAPTASAPAAPAAQAGDLSGIVQENIAAGAYNYTHIKTAAGEDLWAAATGTPPAVGQAVSFSAAMPMKDFHSETLNRDFPLVYFVEAINGGGASASAPAAAPNAPSAGLPYMPSASAPASADAPAIPGAAALVVAAPTGPPAGLITIEKAWTDKAALSGRQVTIKGKVVKATNGILGKNWLHVQDGTGAEGTNDITLTTADTAAVGDSIQATGILATDRDVGSGYAYPVIVLDAKLGG